VSESWRWVALDVVLAIHDRQIAEHGGLDGIRDENALLSALARPQQREAYGRGDAADFAAAYAWGILRNHPFADGNKRTAWVIARLFLLDNDRHLSFDQRDAIRLMESAASGALTEDAVALWLRERIG
jgi:death on curing protein